MAAQATSLTIRVQARGGKFLADDIGGASVTVRDVRSGEILASGVTRGSSGTLLTTEELMPGDLERASLSVVRTPPHPDGDDLYTDVTTIRWLVADDQTSKFVAELDLDGPRLLEISAFGSLGGLQTAHRVSSTLWLAPGLPGPSDPGFVLEIPGLVVQVQQPATHFAISSVPATLPIEANVAMMCGCPIDHGEPWVPDDFRVSARVGVVGSQGVETIALAFDEEAGVAGRFTGSFEVTAVGYYQAVIVAEQLSTGNTGSGLVTFYYEPS